MRKTQAQTVLFAIVLLLIWWQAGLWYQSQLISDERGRVATHLNPHGTSLAMGVSERLEMLDGLNAFIEAEIGSPKGSLGEKFMIFSENIYSGSRGILNIAVAPDGIFRYVYPIGSGRSMIGQSLFQDLSPAYRADIQRAMDTRQPVITHPHEMRRGGLGMVARRAVYENDSFWGIISITVDILPVLRSAGLSATSGNLNFALRDSMGQVFFGDDEVFGSDPVIYRVELSDSYWELAAVPTKGWSGSVQVPLRIAQMAGLIIIGLLTILFYMVASRQDVLNLMITERTSDLNRELGERKRAEKALQERELYLRAIFEAAENVAFIIADAKSPSPQILEFSPGAEKIFGYSREDVIGEPLSILLVPEDHSKLSLVVGIMKKDKTFSGSRTLLRANQERFPAMYSLYALHDESEEIYAALGVCIDITEQKKMEEELLRARDAAEESARAKAEFTANVSHEMRTPLNAVIGMTDLLLESDLDPVKRDYVNTIRSSGLSLLSIINEILDFSKIDARKMEIVDTPLDLHETIESALDQVAPRAAEKRLELAYCISDDISQRISGDPKRLGQILVNLASNAIKFTESGEVTVSVSADRDNGVYHFTVKDTGIGIPEDRMSSLFLPFSQVDTSLSRRYDGTGLGLAISSKLVQLMGGRIWAESNIGMGSQFHFTIPAKTPGYAPPAIDAASSLEELDHSILTGKKGLIIASMDSVGNMLAGHLGSFGMTAARAGSGLDGEKLLDGGIFDVVIADYDIAGAHLLAERLEGKDLESLPLIEMGFLGVKARFPEWRINGYLTKPIRRAQLGRALLRIFGGAEASEEIGSKAVLPPKEFSSYRILLAEDNPVNQKVALAMLRHLGYGADVAANGMQVLSMLEQKAYDVILMDIQMPEMDGLEAARLIRRRLPAARQPRIIAMTAYTMKGDREQCMAAGMDEYIAKPVKMEDLKRVMEGLVGSD
jgi:PAS domain S-box-containing protein